MSKLLTLEIPADVVEALRLPDLDSAWSFLFPFIRKVFSAWVKRRSLLTFRDRK
jgi:hypothetical protein